MKHFLVLFFLIVIIIPGCYDDYFNNDQGQVEERYELMYNVSISGKVLDKNTNSPIKNIIVKLYIGGVPKQLQDELSSYEYTYTNSNGAFSFYVPKGYNRYLPLPDGSSYEYPYQFFFTLYVNMDDEGVNNINYTTTSKNIGEVVSDYSTILYITTRK